MPPSRWHVPGSIAVGTTFDEPTDRPTPVSIRWLDVGSAIRHEGGDTLNLLEAAPAAVNKGPSMHWWGLNAAAPPKAVRLASVGARFSATGDGRSSGYLSFSTKPATGDLVEALRITEHQAILVPKSLSIGPVTAGSRAGRLEISGLNAELALLKRSLTTWPSNPAAGDQILLYNSDGHVRFWTDGAGDLLTVSNTGHLGISGTLQWLGSGGVVKGSAGYVSVNDSSLTITNRGRVHIAGEELLYLLNKAGVIIGKDWGGNGNLSVQGRLGVLGQPTAPRTPGWAGGIRTWDLEAEGTVWSRGGYQSGNRDLAENYRSPEALEPGDVVCLHPENDTVCRSSTPESPLVVGVISTAPGVRLNAGGDSPVENMYPVALCGRVPCKVTGENGPVARGDLLVASSTPGYAMKAPVFGTRGSHRPGTLIGKALEPLASDAGVIEVFVFHG